MTFSEEKTDGVLVLGVSGKIVLAQVTEWIQQVLRISGCASVIGVYPSKEEALKALKA